MAAGGQSREALLRPGEGWEGQHWPESGPRVSKPLRPGTGCLGKGQEPWTQRTAQWGGVRRPRTVLSWAVPTSWLHPRPMVWTAGESPWKPPVVASGHADSCLTLRTQGQKPWSESWFYKHEKEKKTAPKHIARVHFQVEAARPNKYITMWVLYYCWYF